MNDYGLEEAIKNMRNRGIRLGREGDIWSQDEKDRLEELFYEGVGISEIAIRLQRTEPAVIQQIEKMDLYQRKSYPNIALVQQLLQHSSAAVTQRYIGIQPREVEQAIENHLQLDV